MHKKLGLFVFGCVAFAVTAVLAQEGEAAAETVKAVLADDVKKYLAIAAGFGIAIASFGGAFGQARAIAAAVSGITRNPEASGKIFVPMIVGLALIESLVLYAWIVALQLSGKI